MTKYQTGEIEVLMSGQSITIDVDALMDIRTEDLTTEFAEQASLLAYVSTLAAEAEAEWGYVKRELEEVQARIYADVREDLLSVPGDKVTEAKINSEVVRTKGYIEAVEAEIEAKMQYRILRGLVDAMSQRGSMLQSLGAQLRAELDQTGMVTRELKDLLSDVKARQRLPKEAAENDIPF